jgi:hypothetical protein
MIATSEKKKAHALDMGLPLEFSNHHSTPAASESGGCSPPLKSSSGLPSPVSFVTRFL